MDIVNSEYLLRPKERTFEGVCEYLEEARKELKKAEAKKNVTQDELNEKMHRVKILELKMAKYERMKDEKKGKKKNIPIEARFEERKDSTLLVMERVNDEIDEQTSEHIIEDAINLMGDSPALTRFLSYFNENDETGSTTEGQLMVSVLEVLEKNFAFGDELLAKLIVSHGMKSHNLDEFEDLVQHISKQYQFSDELIETLYKIISSEKSAEFRHDEVTANLEKLKADTEAIVLKLASVTEDKEQLLGVVVQAVGYWATLMEITNKIRIQLAANNIQEDLQELIAKKKRLGKHIANMFSTISYIRASVGSWNMENATATMDEATKSAWRVTAILIDFNVHCVKVLKDSGATGKQALVTNSQKLTKFFGVKPPLPKTDPLEHIIEDDSFSRDIFFTMEGHVKGGTLEKLVERLTHHSIDDTEFAQALFLTYSSFTNAETLMSLILKRFQLEPPKGLAPQETEFFTEKKIIPLKKKVVTVLKQWIEADSAVFQSNDDLRASLIEFMITVITPALPNHVSQVEEALNGPGNVSKFPSFKKDDKVPHPIMPKSLRHLSILGIDPLEIARHLTIIDFDIFKEITPKEFHKLAWSKKDSAVLAPNITALIHRSTHLTSFVCAKILEETDLKQRSEVLKHFILVADRCRYLQNYNSLMAIHGGLMSSSIHRLQRTWKLLGKREHQILEELKELMSYRRNFGDYRAMLKNAKPPCIPFLGLYLTDLTFIEDGNKDFLANSEFINFDKRMKTARVVQEIQRFQRQPFQFQPVPQIMEYLSSISHYEKDEEEFYEISQQVEKKESETELLTRVLSDSGFI